jgi:hypothetical protein
MPKKIELPIVTRHLDLYLEDWEFLLLHFSRHGPKALGAGPAVRAIVHQKVKALRAEQIKRLDELAPGEAERDSRVMERIMRAEAEEDAISTAEGEEK